MYVVNVHMLICLFMAIQQIVDGSMHACQAALLVGEWVVDAHIGSRWHNVEFWVEHVNTIYNPIEAGQCERLVALVLSHGLSTANIKNLI